MTDECTWTFLKELSGNRYELSIINFNLFPTSLYCNNSGGTDSDDADEAVQKKKKKKKVNLFQFKLRGSGGSQRSWRAVPNKRKENEAISEGKKS